MLGWIGGCALFSLDWIEINMILPGHEVSFIECVVYLCLSVISGMGELSRENKVPGPVVPDGPYADCPYLLLDVRDRDLYDSCHIISGG